MTRASFWAGAALLAACLTPVALAGPPGEEGLEVHEWGYLWESGIGDDEITAQDLLGELPSFVRTEAEESPTDLPNPLTGVPGRGLPNTGVPVSFPVPIVPTTTVSDPLLFFYTTKPVTVDVSIRFDNGRPVAWFPRTRGYESQKLTWSEVEVTPYLPRTRNLKPFRDEGNKTMWKELAQARKVPAAYVTCGTQVERYLFYESAVSYPTALIYADTKAGFSLTNTRDYPMLDLYVVAAPVDRQTKVIYVTRLEPRETIELAWNAYAGEMDQRITLVDQDRLQADVESHILNEGLTTHEARLCTDTVLSPSFLQARSRKAIYRLPREVYDEIYPLEITPAPAKLVRVGLVLVPDLAARAIPHFCEVLARGKSQERGRAEQALLDVGRPAAEEVLRHAQYARGKARKILTEVGQELLKMDEPAEGEDSP